MMDRNREILEKRLFGGLTYKNIGLEYGITSERVRQIIQREYERTFLLKDAHELVVCISSQINRLEGLQVGIKKSFQDDNDNDVEIEGVIKIEDMSFSIRTHNCLKKLGIKTIDEFEEISERDLLTCPNLGRKSLNEIKNDLAIHGVRLADKSSGYLDERLSEIRY